MTRKECEQAIREHMFDIRKLCEEYLGKENFTYINLSWRADNDDDKDFLNFNNDYWKNKGTIDFYEFFERETADAD